MKIVNTLYVVRTGRMKKEFGKRLDIVILPHLVINYRGDGLRGLKGSTHARKFCLLEILSHNKLI